MYENKGIRNNKDRTKTLFHNIVVARFPSVYFFKYY